MQRPVSGPRIQRDTQPVGFVCRSGNGPLQCFGDFRNAGLSLRQRFQLTNVGISPFTPSRFLFSQFSVPSFLGTGLVSQITRVQ